MKVIFGTAIVLLVSWLVYPQLFQAIFVLFVVRSVMLFLQKTGVQPPAAWLFFGISCLSIIFLAYQFPNIQVAPYLAIVSINLIVAYVFGSSLYRGLTPILIQFVKLHDVGPELSSGFSTYLKNQCLAWAGFGLISALAGFVAIVWEPARGWINTFLLAFFIVQVLWFIVTHKIAQYRFSRSESWTGTLRLIADQDTWKRLEF